MKKLSKLFSKKEVRKYAVYVTVLLLLLGFVLFFTKLVVFLVFLGLAVLGSFLLVVLGTNSIGIEFITFPSLIFLYIYGWKEASIFSVIALFLYMFITRSISINTMLAFIILPIVLLCFVPFKGVGIFKLGIAMSLIGNGIFTVITIAFGTARIHKRLIYFATHVLWAWFLFGTFGEPVLKLLS